MKKVISVLLSMLMIFSMVGVMAFAEDAENSGNTVVDKATVTVIFYDEDGVTKLEEIRLEPNEELSTKIKNPEKADTETTRYIFKGWQAKDGTIYYQSTLPTPTEADENTTIEYVAVYSKEDLTQRQTFWNLIESIFERFNLLFQYFAEIFGF